MAGEDQSPLGRVRAHFQQKLGGGLKKVEPREGETHSVPEWGLDVYYGPETIEHRDRYLNLLAAQKYEGYLELLLARAKHADGRPIFQESEKAELMRAADPDVVRRVALRIWLDAPEVSVDDAKKS